MTRFISGWQVRKSWGIRAGGRALPGGGSGSAGTHSPWPREPPSLAGTLGPTLRGFLGKSGRLFSLPFTASLFQKEADLPGAGGELAGAPLEGSGVWRGGDPQSGLSGVGGGSPCQWEGKSWHPGWGDRGGGKHEGRAGAQAKDEGSSGLSQTDSAPGQPSPIHFLISEKARSPAVSGAGA